MYRSGEEGTTDADDALTLVALAHPSDYVLRQSVQRGMFLAVVAASLLTAPAVAQEKPEDLRALVREVAKSQIQMLQRRDSRLRYLVHRVDRKGATVRDQIESHDGGVARLVQHNGQMLTTDEDDGERARLNALLGTGKLQRRESDEARNRTYGIELLQAFPDAMRFTTVAQQSPLPDVTDKQVVLDFAPDPAFHPNGIAQQLLTQLNGRLWIDLTDHQLLRMDLHNTADVNLAWGIVAKVYEGGSVIYEQRRFQDLYTFTHIAMHMRVRELLVKTVNTDSDVTTSGFRRLANSPGGDDAIRMLLSEKVPTR